MNKINKQFQKIIKLNSYNHCEIIEIFGIKDKDIFNIYTLITAQNSQTFQEKQSYLTKKLGDFNFKNIKWGIQKTIIPLSKAINLFDSLCQVKPKDKKINISNNNFVSIGELQLLEKIFVEPNKDTIAHCGKSQLNYILKNNFHNGSYIFDFFDRTKEYCNFLLKKSELLNTFNEKLNKIVPIQIENISDRLGNIIFQLPINAINIHIDSEKIGDDVNFKNTINVKINCLNDKLNSKDFIISLSEEKDGETINHAISENTLSATSKNLTSPTITITHKDSGLIFYKKKIFI